jgi:transcriptional regulator with XRE-family HTH domain
MNKRRFAKLRGALAESYLKQKDLAEIIGNCPCTLSHKLSGKASDFTIKEAYLILQALEIDFSEINKYFAPADVLNMAI